MMTRTELLKPFIYQIEIKQKSKNFATKHKYTEDNRINYRHVAFA